MGSVLGTWLLQIIGGIFVEDLIRGILMITFGSATFFPVENPIQSVDDNAGESHQYIIDLSVQSGQTVETELCTEAPAPQLVQDSMAIRVGTINSKLRNLPGLSAKELGRIEVGEKVSVLGGRRCVDEFYWYNIKTRDERVGWVAEGHYRSKRYWYVTLLDDTTCDLPPRFIPGDFATHNSELNNIVRKYPDRTSAKIGSEIHSGESVEVLVGPFCNDFHIWYRVRNESQGIEGWTAEGFDGVYWFDEPSRFYNS